MAPGYVLATADDPDAGIDGSTVRTLHYMMLSHDPAAGLGRYRSGEIFVREGTSGTVAYTGPDPNQVPSLMTELVASTTGPGSGDGFIDAAMAHLNLVMIHPFRDGNGRMARCLQTLVLGRRGVTEPLFSSIEEWLGHNTDDYYRVLAVVGRGVWHPGNDPSLWVKFCLRAHHMQAQTQQQRIVYAARLGEQVGALIEQQGLPDRTFDALYEAAVGLKVRRQRYMSGGFDLRTATRDLGLLTSRTLLEPHGQAPAATTDRRSRCGSRCASRRQPSSTRIQASSATCAGWPRTCAPMPDAVSPGLAAGRRSTGGTRRHTPARLRPGPDRP